MPLFLERIRKVQAQLPHLDHELLLVDDDSGDGSLALLKEEAKRDPRIRVLVTARRFGVYACVRAGLEAARGDAVVYIETDLQDPPEMIPEMVAKWEAGADVVHTTRRVRHGETWIKLKITALAYKLIQSWSEVPIPINTGDFKLLSRRVVDKLYTSKEEDPYFRGLVARAGFNQTTILYDRAPRAAGRSTRSLLSFIPLRVLLSAILSTSTYPLKVAAFAGIFIGLCGLISAGVILLQDARMAGIYGCLGVILLSQAVLAMYMIRIHIDNRRRTVYNIKETVGS